MALFKKRKRKKETARKKRYLKHFKKAKASAMTYSQWIKAGEGRSPDVMLREMKSRPFKRKVEHILSGKSNG